MLRGQRHAMSAMPIALLILHLLLAAQHPDCARNGLLPDVRCTPGAIDAAAMLHVICTTSTRERRHVTETTRLQVMTAYGVPRADWDRYELDHLVSLELGGSNEAANLWPEPLDDARRKDAVEDRVHRAVCAGRMRLEDAQRQMASDWTKLEGVR